VLQCVAVCCSVLQRVAEDCNWISLSMHSIPHVNQRMCMCVCCSVMQCVAV